MIRLTGVVLRHKLLVVLAWLAIAAAGFATVGQATSALSTSFSIPGQAFQTDAAIQRLYHTGGFENPPVVLTATVRTGIVSGPGTAAEAGRVSRLTPGFCPDPSWLTRPPVHRARHREDGKQAVSPAIGRSALVPRPAICNAGPMRSGG